jgi:hypothetical protein
MEDFMKAVSRFRVVLGATAAGAAAMCMYVRLIRPWHVRWGATKAEVERTWPGDEEVPHPTLSATRAVTIEAPPEEVWPWLVQIGKGRAGFYSYEWVENLMGLGIKNVDRILPEFQQLKAGDQIPGLGPVKAVESNRFLLLAGHERWGDLSWLLALEPHGEGRMRLISRSRYYLRWGTLLRSLPPQMVPFYALFEPGEFVMLRKMLLGIERRAEARAKMDAKTQRPPAKESSTPIRS